MTQEHARRVVADAFRYLKRPSVPVVACVEPDLFGYRAPTNPFANYRIRIARLISDEDENAMRSWALDYEKETSTFHWSRWRFRRDRCIIALGMLRDLHADSSALLNELAATGAEPLETIFRYRMIERRYILDILYCIIFRSLYIEDASRRAVECIRQIEALLHRPNLLQMPAR
jgi:hypothetical protein